jgi:hypothetical protein
MQLCPNPMQPFLPFSFESDINRKINHSTIDTLQNRTVRTILTCNRCSFFIMNSFSKILAPRSDDASGNDNSIIVRIGLGIT